MPIFDSQFLNIGVCQVQHNHHFSFPDLDKPFFDSLKEAAITERKLVKTRLRHSIDSGK
jgi:hypothetical protein